MNEYPESGSTFKGQILLHIEADETEKPQRKAKKGIPDTIWEQANTKKMLGKDSVQNYKLMIEFGQSICVPEADTKYRMKVFIN